MFEKYYSTSENTDGYSKADLDRYNLILKHSL